RHQRGAVGQAVAPGGQPEGRRRSHAAEGADEPQSDTPRTHIRITTGEVSRPVGPGKPRAVRRDFLSCAGGNALGWGGWGGKDGRPQPACGPGRVPSGGTDSPALVIPSSIVPGARRAVKRVGRLRPAPHVASMNRKRG